MKAAEMGGQTFIWKRVNAITDHFSLQSGDRALALLKIGGLHGVVARLTSEDLALAFVVEGIADRYINVRDSTTGATLAFYERGRRRVGGKLQLADGGRLDWMRLASWRPARYDGTPTASGGPITSSPTPADARSSALALTVLFFARPERAGTWTSPHSNCWWSSHWDGS
jgi:hypothetical protein